MTFFSTASTSGHVGDAVEHYNIALSMEKRAVSPVLVANALTDSLNKIQTEWRVLHNQRRGERKNFRKMVEDHLQDCAREAFLKSQAVQHLIDLEPPIEDQDKLIEFGWRPGQKKSEAMIEAATVHHQRVKEANTAFFHRPSQGAEILLLSEFANLLYTIRSNISHGEKRARAMRSDQRDITVSQAAIPVYKLLAQSLLGVTDTALVVYGTLAPGGCNEDILASKHGTWSTCQIEGTIDLNSFGLPAFDFDPDGDRNDVCFFESDELPDCWEKLDRFEGSDYVRGLTTVFNPDGTLRVAQVYLGADGLSEGGGW